MKENVILIPCPGSLEEFVELAIQYQTNSANEFREWIVSNSHLDENSSLMRYANYSLPLVERRLEKLKLANAQIKGGFGTELAKKELKEEISLCEKVIRNWILAGLPSEDSHILQTNELLVALQILEDDLEGKRRESFGAPELEENIDGV